MRSSSEPDKDGAAMADGGIGKTQALDGGIATCAGLRGLVRAAVVQPVEPPVAADDAAYLQRKGCAKLAFRTARRRLQFAIDGQRPYLRTAIERGWQRILWIKVEAPQLGDTLMDLAPRSLLAEQGIALDVYTAPHLADALQGDRWIGGCIAAPSPIDATRYDAVIASSHAARALEPKRRWAPALPWVSIAGEYSVPDYHRGLLAAQRLADLLGVHLDDVGLHRHARQKLDVPGPAPTVDEGRIAIAVGGVHSERTYAHWPEVVGRLADAGWRRLVLVGSQNGRAAANAVRKAAPRGMEIEDAVAAATVQSTRQHIQDSAAVLCADGGLLHLSLTTSTPVIALFNAAVVPAWRLPMDFVGAVLQSSGEVSLLTPAAVVASLTDLVGARQELPNA